MKALIKVFIVVFLIMFLIPMLCVIAGEIGIVSWFAGCDFGYILITVVSILLFVFFLIKIFS
ncbi:MAG: hypothetical protein II037_04890 [Bacteroidales bacterium]|nr:hypothetical protein [Bacteroidales bacterium]